MATGVRSVVAPVVVAPVGWKRFWAVMRGLLGSHAQSGLFWDVMCNMGSSRVSCPKKGLLGSHVRLQLGGLLGCHARGLVGCHVSSGSFGGVMTKVR